MPSFSDLPGSEGFFVSGNAGVVIPTFLATCRSASASGLALVSQP
jgi:hypothetical protein